MTLLSQTWAAGENAEGIMISELRRFYGNPLAETIEALDPYSHAASAQMRLFASPMIGGSLSPAGAQRLCRGFYDDGYVHNGQRADPNSPGLEGHTALMYMVIAGNVPTIQAEEPQSLHSTSKSTGRGTQTFCELSDS
ncbi:hypothetical protein AK812_SmicGene11378 [Symbiodinium microadriaticum]|uniref:Uncharacterized protein n=1 Tax=Symbiodinium microadriaticum TaxID=2951 RepID=A0A1Q9EDC7_SYMMI|nr:hypothetical protein AK812_SmicGene11378 [Symbiodinium microadriaticum]